MRKESKNTHIFFFFFVNNVFEPIYQVKAKSKKIQKRITYFKNRTNKNQTLHSQKLKRKGIKHKINGKHPNNKRKKKRET